MKRFILTICLGMSLMVSWAQVEAKYGKGSVPVVNGRVMFQDTIHTTLAPEVAYGKVLTWAKKRFQKPNVIISKFVSNDIQNQQLNVTAEEYLVFTNRFFVFDRTRINYWVDIKCHQGYTVLTITRINYWYEEERNGGLRFNAEEMITDKEAFNKKGTKLLKDQGKFRRKTIDFFDQCVMQLSEALN